MRGRQGGPERARGGRAQAGPCRRPARDHVPRGRRTFVVKGLAERHVPKADGALALRGDDAPLAPEVLEARRLERLLAPRDGGGSRPTKKETAPAREGARVVRRLPRPRLYELLLLADFALVVLLLRLKARLGLDVVQNASRHARVRRVAGALPPRRRRASRAPRRAAGVAARDGARLRALVLKPRSLARSRPPSPVRWRSRRTSTAGSRWRFPCSGPDVLYDQDLFRLETVLHFGVNPGRLLQGLFPYAVALEAPRRVLRRLHPAR